MIVVPLHKLVDSPVFECPQRIRRVLVSPRLPFAKRVGRPLTVCFLAFDCIVRACERKMLAVHDWVHDGCDGCDK